MTKRTKKSPNRLDVAVQTSRLLILSPDGTKRYEPVLKDSVLAQLQRLVGGYIEVVPSRCQLDANPACLIVNEDGISRSLPDNLPATMLTGGLHHILGTAVVIPRKYL